MVLRGGATCANLSCVDSTHFAVSTNNPFAVLQDTAKDDDKLADTSHVDRESSYCFAKAVNVQWANWSTIVFTHN
jgi:hypothetical protein